MAAKVLLACVLLALVASHGDHGHHDHDHEHEGETSNVLTLTDSTLAEALQQHQSILVEFYAPWCGHCKRLAPEYEKAANLLVEKGSNAKVAKVDSTVEKASSSAYSIRGYPTLLYFENGQMVEKYSGGRTADEIANYLLGKVSATGNKQDL
jgi:protein disulfide-isomerase A1